MTRRLAFLLGKDPATSHGGDMTMFRTMRAIASERYSTEVLCLSERPDLVEPDVVRVPKPPISRPQLAARSLALRRSLVHVRFDVDSLRDAIEESYADLFVAEHSYMAEAFLRTSRGNPGRDLLVSTDVPESSVWRSTHRVTGWIEGRRLRRDELRVAGAVRALGGYDRAEMAAYRALGFNAHWLPITLPPASRIAVAGTPPRLVVLGNRKWRPNAEAAEMMVRLWSRIAADIPDAELWLVGPKPDGAETQLPAGVTDLGFVDDVDTVLAVCRALAAPVSVGEGVRVKVLEAAARGLPVVATHEAIGSIEASLGVPAARDEQDFVARCRTFLLDADAAAADGARLHAANARRWTDRVGHEAVHEWLTT
jgi:glycosyltransferase involved in cell wall biosynthesis